jgi:hypothetical protein
MGAGAEGNLPFGTIHGESSGIIPVGMDENDMSKLFDQI